MDETLINDPDARWDAEVLKLVEEYAACDKRSDAINKERADIRARAESKHGIPSLHFQHAVQRAKKMTKTERSAYDENVNRIIAVVETKQAEFWPEQAEKGRKRDADRIEAAKDKKTGLNTDTNPRSDPARGGAGRASKKKLDAAAAKLAAEAEEKQADGQVDLEQAIADRKAAEAEDAEHVFDNIEGLGGPH